MYWEEIKSIALAVFEETMSEHDNDIDSAEDHFYDNLHETLDGHSWVIYNHYNLEVLQHASNPEAMIDSMGAEEAGIVLADRGLAGLHNALTYWAMYEDAQSELQDLIDDYEPEEQDYNESEEGEE